MAQFFHTLNRGVDKRKIFLDEEDYFRFIHDLFEFNNQERVETTWYNFQRNKLQFKFNDIASRKIKIERKPRKLLVDIHAFCLMPNHYHLLISPRAEFSISRFMKKINMGYAKYFNEKYERRGALFEGRYRSATIKQEPHFIYIPYYIHLNPLDIRFPGWRNKEIRNYKEAVKFLESYRWSSYLDYIGKKNFPSVTKREFLLEFFSGSEQYRRGTIKWLKEIDLEEIKEVILEE